MLSAFGAIAGTAAVNDTAVVYGIFIFILTVLIAGGYIIKIVKKKLKGHEKTNHEQQDESQPL